MSETVINVPGRFNPIEYGTPLANASDIYDTNHQKSVQETLNEENDKIALQDTKINTLNTVGELIEHPDGYLVKAYNIGDIFYKIESLKDIQIKHYYVARIDGFAGDQITDTEKFIDAGTSSVNALNVKTTIIKGALEGDDAYEVYVKQWKQDHPGMEPTPENGFLEQDEWLESLIGDDAYEIAVEEGFEGSKSDWLASLKGEKGDNAVNPFKGWLISTDALPDNPNVGDYAYIKDNGTTYIYRCTTDGEWPTTSIEEKEPSDASFASAQLLNNTKIDDTHLANPIGSDEDNNPTLVKAEDVMQLKAKLEGVTASETKVQLYESGEGQNVYDGYINGSTGEYIQSNYNKFIVVPLNGAKSVRWLGKENASNPSNIGWAFGTFGGEIDSTLSTFTALSKGVYANNQLDNQAVEYDKGAIEGATHAVITIWIYKYGGGSAVTTDNFYCYLQSGDSVIDRVVEITDKISGKDKKTYEDDNIINSDNFTLNSYGCFYNTDVETDTGYTYSNLSSYASKTNFIGNLLEQGYKSIVVSGSTTDYTYVTFLKKYWGTGEKTVKELFDGGYLCDVHNKSGKPVIVLNIGAVVELQIPEDCEYLFFTKRTPSNSSSTNRLPTKITLVKHTHINGELDDIQEEVAELSSTVEDMQDGIETNAADISTLNDVIYGEEKEETETINLSTATTVVGQLLSTGIKGKNAGSNGRICIIPVIADSIIDIAADSTYNTYLCILNQYVKISANTNISTNVVVNDYKANGCDGYEPSSDGYRMIITHGSSATITIAPNSNAKYLYIQKRFHSDTNDRLPESLTITTKLREGGLIEKDSSSISVSGLTLSYGDLDVNGNVVEDNSKIVTGFLSIGNGFYIEFAEGYNVEKAMLYDTNGKLTYSGFYTKKATNVQCMGRDGKLSQFLVRLVIKNDSIDTYNDDLNSIVRMFAYLNDSRIQRLIPSYNKFPIFIKRVNQLNSIVWKTVNNAQYINNTQFKNGSTVIGVPYSGVGEYSKFLGIDVAFRTFLTAVKNKRSVVYTENIQGSTSNSAYGLIYHGENGYSGSFYGSICTGLLSYIRGQAYCNYVGDIPSIFSSNKIAEGHYDNVTEKSTVAINGSTGTSEELFAMLQPMDLIWNTGHISVVSNVYRDEYGNNRYVVWSEQTTPCGRDNTYSSNSFGKRLDYIVNSLSGGNHKEWKIFRLTESDWNDVLVDPYLKENTFSYIQNMFDEFEPSQLEIDENISTFEGEYAVFVINGDNDDNTDSYNNYKAFLNICRGQGLFTKLQIFDEYADVEETDAIATIDITSNSVGDNPLIKQSNIYSEDASDKEDWIIVDLMQISPSLGAGKYKARIINDTAGSEAESGFTHFQLVEISFEVGEPVNGKVNEVTFSVDGGTPILIQRQGVFGVTSYGDNVSISQPEVSAGKKNLLSKEWELASDWHPYIKIVVQCDYGTAVKRINMNDLI